MEEKPILVVALVKNQGKILIIERANKETGMTWTFPGGEVESGELPEVANAEWVEPEEILKNRFSSEPALEVRQFMLVK